MRADLLAALLVFYVPGALIFRIPLTGRGARAALDAEERVYWHVLLSIAWSLAVVLAMAALDVYRFERVLIVNAAVSLVIVGAGRTRLLYRGAAPRPGWTAVMPVALVLLGLWRFFPSSEYVIGGKDPGVYMNEGIQIAQRGSLVIHDDTVAAVPEFARSLFFPPSYRAEYDSLRFMGFFVLDPRAGQVVGQFPQLFPASVAIGYGLDGLSGARRAVGAWALLGVLGLYFLGARITGRSAATAAAVLLTLNAAEVWFARYPNSDIAMQALLLAALLAFARARDATDALLGITAGALVGLLLFLRVDGVMVVAGFGAASVVTWVVERRRLDAGFITTVAIALALFGWYMAGPMRPYLAYPLVWLRNLPRASLAAAAVAIGAGTGAVLWLRRRDVGAARRAVPWAIVAVVLAAAGYALFFRQAGGRLTDYDAAALRTFAQSYLLPSGTALALAGFVLMMRRDFWRAPAFAIMVTGFALFFFYKIHVVPEQFWMARHYLPIILPGALLFAAIAADALTRLLPRRLVGTHAGLVVLIVVGFQYQARAAPLLSHVEYAGVIPFLEQLASRFGDRDLVLVESRDTGADTHVLALPLAYIYAKHVLVLSSARPDKIQLATWLERAARQYSRVIFLGGGGTDLLSRRIVASPVADVRVQVPEYATTPWNEYPEGPRRKDFDATIYRLALGAPETAEGFRLDLGFQDDLYAVRFYAKETTEGRSIRWTTAQSYIAVPGISGAEREVTLTMSNGGRPDAAPPAHVNVFFDGTPIGTVTVTPEFQDYRFALPPAAVAAAARRDDPAQLRLVATTWNPHGLLGTPDDRNLGVMVDKAVVK